MDSILDYLKLVLPPVTIAVVIACVLIFHFYNTIKSFFGDVIKLFGFGSKLLNKKATAYLLEGKIGGSIQKVTTNRTIMPNGLIIEWNKGEERETFLRNKKVVVVLNKDEPEERQFVRAVMEFVRRGLIPSSKARLDKRAVDAADTKVAQSIISQKGPETISYFEETFLKPFFNHEESKRLVYDMMRKIEGNGMLYQLLLNEYEEVAAERLSDGPNQVLEQESMEFLSYVYRIANKRPGENVPLAFLRQFFRVSIILATKEVQAGIDEEDDLGNYVSQIQKSINNGAWKIYVYALGRKVERAREIAAISSQLDGRIVDVKYHPYSRKNDITRGMLEGICIELRVSKIGL